MSNLSPEELLSSLLSSVADKATGVPASELTKFDIASGGDADINSRNELGMLSRFFIRRLELRSSSWWSSSHGSLLRATMFFGSSPS